MIGHIFEIVIQLRRIYKVFFNIILSSAGCDNPKVQARSYTSTDAQILTHIPFIAEFTLTCSNGEASIPLYASINGALSE